MAIMHNGDVCVVLDMQHRTPGNLRAFVQATLRSVRTGKSSDIRFSSTERVDVVPMVTRKMEFSYKDGEDFVFSDPETFETISLPPEIVGDAKNFLVENTTVTVTFVEEKAVQIELPAAVVLTVADAPEGIRGDSANNVQKTVTLETDHRPGASFYQDGRETTHRHPHRQIPRTGLNSYQTNKRKKRPGARSMESTVNVKGALVPSNSGPERHGPDGVSPV